MVVIVSRRSVSAMGGSTRWLKMALAVAGVVVTIGLLAACGSESEHSCVAVPQSFPEHRLLASGALNRRDIRVRRAKVLPGVS
jgi:hypothetical protein